MTAACSTRLGCTEPLLVLHFVPWTGNFAEEYALGVESTIMNGCLPNRVGCTQAALYEDSRCGRDMAVARAGAILCSLLLVALSACSGPSSSSAGAPVVTIVPVSDSAAAGTPLEFTVHAQPAPSVNMAVGIAVAAEPDGCVPDEGSPATVMINAGATQSALTVSTTDVEGGCEVSATVSGGTGYDVGEAATASASTSESTTESDGATESEAAPEDSDLPVVTIDGEIWVHRGAWVSFWLSADRPLTSELQVNIRWSGTEAVMPDNRPETVTMPDWGGTSVGGNTSDAGVDGNVTVTVESGDGYVVGTPSSATMRVADPGPRQPLPRPRYTDQWLANMTVEVVGRSALIEGQTAVFRIIPWGGRGWNPFEVGLEWEVQGDFFGSLPDSVVFEGYWPAYLEVETVDDDVIEPDGSLTLTLVYGTSYGYRVGIPASATVTVANDDTDLPKLPEVTVEPGPSPVTEGGTASVTLTAAPKPESSLTVNVEWWATGVLNGPFFDEYLPRTTTMVEATHQMTARIRDNDSVDGNRQVNFVVRPGTGYTLGEPKRATVDIADDD